MILECDQKYMMSSRMLILSPASQVTGKAEREVAADLLGELLGRKITIDADKSFDTAGLVDNCRAINITPRVAHNDNCPCGSAIDVRISRYTGCQVSQKC